MKGRRGAAATWRPRPRVTPAEATQQCHISKVRAPACRRARTECLRCTLSERAHRAAAGMLRGLALLCAVSGVSSTAIELTPENFDDVVFKSGKSAFIKFLAPW